jgi:hypothetical protein
MPCSEWDYDPWTPQQNQRKDWDCSAAATAWMGRSLGWGWAELDVAYEFQSRGIATPQLGLLDGTGAGIVRWLSLQPMPATNFVVQFDDAVDLVANCPLIMGSSTLYHWLGVRTWNASGDLELANSAPGWGSVYQSMTRATFDRLAPWWAVQPTSS